MSALIVILSPCICFLLLKEEKNDQVAMAIISVITLLTSTATGFVAETLV